MNSCAAASRRGRSWHKTVFVGLGRAVCAPVNIPKPDRWREDWPLNARLGFVSATKSARYGLAAKAREGVQAPPRASLCCPLTIFRCLTPTGPETAGDLFRGCSCPHSTLRHFPATSQRKQRRSSSFARRPKIFCPFNNVLVWSRSVPRGHALRYAADPSEGQSQMGLERLVRRYCGSSDPRARSRLCTPTHPLLQRDASASIRRGGSEPR
jgi:hypothetical protein